MKLNRKNMYSNKVMLAVKIIAKCIGVSRYKILGRFIDFVETNKVVINTNMKNRKLVIRYSGKMFSTDDLNNTVDCVIGEGKRVILNSVESGMLQYTYLNGENIYTIKIDEDTEFDCSYDVIGPINTVGGQLIVDICGKVKGGFFYTEVWYETVQEIVSNIVNYTNIKDAKANFMIMCLEVIRFGLRIRNSGDKR